MINAGTSTEPLKDENIWFSILNSISSSKVTQCKNLLILGKIMLFYILLDT